MRKDVLCLGNIAYDLIMKEKPALGFFSAEAFPGGSVYNTAVLLSRLGYPVTIIAKTGQDFLGEHLIRTLRKDNVNTSFILRDDDVKTSLAIARINKNGDSSYLFYRPENIECSLKDIKVPACAFRTAGVFHTGSAFTYKDITFEDTLRFLTKAKRYGVFTTYDPNWREKRIKDTATAKKRIYELLGYIDLLKLSDTDALGITGEKTLSAALKKLPANTVVTLGEKGAFHKMNREKTFTPAFKIKAADTIGAGDAFSAGLIYRYLEEGPESLDKNITRTLRFASAVAALVSSSSGATGGLKGLHQVKAFLGTR